MFSNACESLHGLVFNTLCAAAAALVIEQLEPNFLLTSTATQCYYSILCGRTNSCIGHVLYSL